MTDPSPEDKLADVVSDMSTLTVLAEAIGEHIRLDKYLLFPTDDGLLVAYRPPAPRVRDHEIIARLPRFTPVGLLDILVVALSHHKSLTPKADQ